MPATGSAGLYPKFHGFDRDGLPLEGGKLHSYLSGTSTPHAMYADAELTTALPNPIVLDASGEALFYSNGTALKWTLTDADDVPLWTIDPVTSAGGGVGSGGGLILTPAPVLCTAGGGEVLVPNCLPGGWRVRGVTAKAVTDLGNSQGLTGVLIGDATLVNRWGALPGLAEGAESALGDFYPSEELIRPPGQPGSVVLSALGGTFDGIGQLAVTIYLESLPSPGASGGGAGLDLSPATTEHAGVVELATSSETLTGTDQTRAVTPFGLQAKFLTVPGITPASETVAGVLELATTAEVTAGTDHQRAVTPLKLAGRLGDVIPSGTPFSVPRSPASGVGLENTTLKLDTNTNLVLGAGVPAAGATRTLVLSSGVTPNAGAIDAVQMTVADVEGIAGQAGLHVRFENGVLMRMSGQGIFSRVQLITPTPTIAAPYIVSVDESGRYFVPIPGAGVMAQFNLPPAAAGLIYTVLVYQSGGIRVRAQGDDQIRLAGTLGSAAGAIECTTIGTPMTLLAVNTVLWQSMSPITGWTAIA